MASRSILILGGTGEARRLAERLVTQGDRRVILSLAGRTSAPLPQAGELRIGGFGGAEGLAHFMRAEDIGLTIDATHPFAARISAHAAIAAQAAGVPLITLRRPAWRKEEGDRWTEVARMEQAVQALGAQRRIVFLAIGRQEVGAFRAAPQHHYVIRSVEPVNPADTPPDATPILARGPFDAAAEQGLLSARGIEVVVAKNSGGAATYGKIAAARALGIPVIMVSRPPSAGGLVLPGVEEVLAVVADGATHDVGIAAERGE